MDQRSDFASCSPRTRGVVDRRSGGVRNLRLAIRFGSSRANPIAKWQCRMAISSHILENGLYFALIYILHDTAVVAFGHYSFTYSCYVIPGCCVSWSSGRGCRAVFCTRRAGVRGRLSLWVWHVFGFGSSLRIGAQGVALHERAGGGPGGSSVRASGEQARTVPLGRLDSQKFLAVITNIIRNKHSCRGENQ